MARYLDSRRYDSFTILFLNLGCDMILLLQAIVPPFPPTSGCIVEVPHLLRKVHDIREFALHCGSQEVDECGFLVGRFGGAQLGEEAKVKAK